VLQVDAFGRSALWDRDRSVYSRNAPSQWRARSTPVVDPDAPHCDMSTAGHRKRTRTFQLLIAVASLAAVLLVVLSYPPSFSSRRPPTESEMVVSYFAENLGEASLCEKISWAAYQRYNVLFGGGGASYTRSDCYQSVAVRRHAPAVCWKVRPLVDVNPESSGYSALSCRRHATQGVASTYRLRMKP
jgi:hypothetical protein